MKSFAHLLRIDPGFDPEGRVTLDVVLLPINMTVHQNEPCFIESFFGISTRRQGSGHRVAPCIFHAEVSSGSQQCGVMNLPKGEEPIVYFNLFAGDYFRSMGIPLVHGRLPTEREMWEPSDVILINQTMAMQLFGDVNPLERRVETREDGQWSRVIGIVGNVRQKSLDEPPKAELYVPFSGMPIPFLTIVAHTTLPDAGVLQVIRREVRNVDSDIVINNAKPLSGLSKIRSRPAS